MAASERRLKAVQMRIAGYDQRQIAAQLGVNESTISRDLKRVLEENGKLTDEETLQWRILWAMRYEALLNGIWLKAKGGGLAAIDRVLKVGEQQAKILGLYSPQKIAPTTPDGTEPWEPVGDELTDTELDARITAIFDAARARGAAPPAFLERKEDGDAPLDVAEGTPQGE